MDSINVVLATVILVAFIVTIVLGAGSYLAYKLRERKRPQTGSVTLIDREPVFFERITPASVPPRAGQGDDSTRA